jgi:hypothetical protein
MPSPQNISQALTRVHDLSTLTQHLLADIAEGPAAG